MKIAMVFDGLQIGGIERVGIDYAKIFISLGYEVKVFNLVPSLREMESKFPHQCSFVHVNFPNKFCPERYNKIIRWKSWGKWIFPIWSGLLSILCFFYKFLLKYRKEFWEEFDIIIAFSGHYDDLTFVANNYITAKHKVCWLHGALYSYILTSDGFINLYKKINNLIVLTRDCEVEVFSYNPFLHFNIKQIYNPVSFYDAKISMKNVQLLRKKYGEYILMISRMDMPHKRPDTLIDAFEICHMKYGLKHNLVFVGDGPDLDKIKRYAMTKNQNVYAHIYFEGSKMNVQDYYKSATLFVQSSSFEGLPTTIIEALQMGIPVIATDCQTGPREILGDNRYGLLCKVGDPEDMAEKIYRILTDKKLAEHYKNIGQCRGKDFYPQKIQEKIKDLFNGLMTKE